VEAWSWQVKDTVPGQHDQYRIFGGPYSLVGIDEVNLYSSGRLHFALFFSEEPPPFVPPHLVDVRSVADGVKGYPISALNGQWIHVAGVSDRKGIAGTTDAVSVCERQARRRVEGDGLGHDCGRFDRGTLRLRHEWA